MFIVKRKRKRREKFRRGGKSIERNGEEKRAVGRVGHEAVGTGWGGMGGWGRARLPPRSSGGESAASRRHGAERARLGSQSKASGWGG